MQWPIKTYSSLKHDENIQKRLTVLVEILQITGKHFQLRGRALSPDPLTQNSASGPCWGLSPEIAIIGLHYHAQRAPLFQLPDPPVICCDMSDNQILANFIHCNVH